MHAAQRTRTSVRIVEQLRQECFADPLLGKAVRAVKRFQASRFAGTYADLLNSGRHRAATKFFLEELYGDKDYAQRDAQFSRIAGAMQSFFPEQVVSTAVSLAGLHALTEQLDHAMGLAWVSCIDCGNSDTSRYINAWRAVGRRPEREEQLKVVLGIGVEISRLTRTPGLRTMLRMMRGPAAAAGLSSLQRFLESGFDTFAALSRQEQGVEEFLALIRERESALISNLFECEFVACETKLLHELGSCPVRK